VTGPGTLTDVTLSGPLDVGSGGGAVNMVDGTFTVGSSLLLDIAGTGGGQYDTFSANATSDVSGGFDTTDFASITKTST